MIPLVGTDIVELARIRKLSEKHPESFLHKVFAEEERQRIAELGDPIPFMAGRWAAKEAIYKMLSADVDLGIGWKEMVVLRHSSGRPMVRLEGRAQRRAAELGLDHIALSISHCKDYAVAYAHGLAKGEE